MRAAGIYRPPTGVAVFEVGRDRKVVLVDLAIAGVKVARRPACERYEKQYDIVRRTLETLGLNMDIFSSEKVLLRYRGRTLLACFYHTSGSPIVKYVVISSLSPGILSKLSKKLESLGWRRRIFLELRSKRPAHV